MNEPLNPPEEVVYWKDQLDKLYYWLLERKIEMWWHMGLMVSLVKPTAMQGALLQLEIPWADDWDGEDVTMDIVKDVRKGES